MNPRIRSRMPASIGSNQASPANKPCAARSRRAILSHGVVSAGAPTPVWLVEQAGDYATTQFHHLRDGTIG